MKIGQHLSNGKILLLMLILILVSLSQTLLRPFQWYTLAAIYACVGVLLLLAVILLSRFIGRKKL